jgi:hypothetical protein
LHELLPDSLENWQPDLEEGSPTLPGFLKSQARDAIAKTLDIDVFEILAKAWGVARALREYADKTKHPPKEVSTLNLGKHEFTTNLHPVLTFQVGSFPPRPFEFSLELKVVVGMVTLEIQEQRICAVAAGDCRVTAQLKYKKVPLHTEKKSKALPLSARHVLEAPGILIAGAAS